MNSNADCRVRSAEQHLRGICWLMLVIGIFVRPLTSLATDATAEFDAANKLYEQGRYREAIAAYEVLAQKHPGDAAVLFNLGNAHFKAGQNGLAIAAYHNAQQLDPRDPDIRANLKFARNQVSGPTFRSGWLQRQLGSLTLNEWTLLAVVPVWGFFTLLAIGQSRPTAKARLKTTTMVFGAASIFGVATLATALLQQTGTKMLIVTTRDTIVRHGPLEESQSAFTVADGAELRWLDEKDDWYLVTAGDGRNGWLKSNTVLRAK